MIFFFSSRRRHTRCALVTGVQTCALPISTEVAGLLRILKNAPKSMPPTQVASTLANSHAGDAPAPILRLAPVQTDHTNWLELTLVNNATHPLALRLVAGASRASGLRFLVNRNGA